VSESDHYSARVYLSEALSRRDDPVNAKFYWQLIRWVENCRFRIIADSRKVTVPPAQGDLF
jgi:hypothetical protein